MFSQMSPMGNKIKYPYTIYSSRQYASTLIKNKKVVSDGYHTYLPPKTSQKKNNHRQPPIETGDSF